MEWTDTRKLAEQADQTGIGWGATASAGAATLAQESPEMLFWKADSYP